MRVLVFILSFVLTLLALDWSDDYNGALAEAKHNNKDIYLFLGSEHCPYCAKFKKSVLEQKDVENRLKKEYVLLYLSREIDDIPSHLETKPVPRHYFLDKNGKIIYTTIGDRTKDGFYEMLDEVKDLK